jgi:transposase-like protein
LATRLTLYKRDDVRRLIANLLKGSGEIVPRRDPATGDYTFGGMKALGVSEVPTLLEELEAHGILEKYRIDSIPACPKCGHSNFFLNYLCPSCRHQGLEQATMIEHYACGHVDLESNFKSGNDLVCPKCSRTLKLIGRDYRKMENVYHCSKCNGNSGAPIIEFVCRVCENTLLPDQTRMMPIFAYKLNEKLRSELVHHCTLENQIIDVLKRLGYDTKTQWVERGFSGIEHTFDIYAEKEGSEIVLDVVSGNPEVGLESIASFFAKIYDLKPGRAILIATPRLTREAQRMSALYKIDVVAGIQVEELLQRLQQLLIKAPTMISTIPGIKEELPLAKGIIEIAPQTESNEPSSLTSEVSLKSLRRRMAALLEDSRPVE